MGPFGCWCFEFESYWWGILKIGSASRTPLKKTKSWNHLQISIVKHLWGKDRLKRFWHVTHIILLISPILTCYSCYSLLITHITFGKITFIIGDYYAKKWLICQHWLAELTPPAASGMSWGSKVILSKSSWHKVSLRRIWFNFLQNFRTTDICIRILELCHGHSIRIYRAVLSNHYLHPQLVLDT